MASLSSKPLLFVAASLVIAVLSSCCTDPQAKAAPVITYNITIKPIGPEDMSVASPNFTLKKYKKIMVVPPSGTARAEFDAEVANVEREFMQRGLILISPAVGARVTEGDEDKKKSETQAQLSDVERALILAKKSNADAILQVGQFQWTNDKTNRYFKVGADGVSLGEVTKSEYDREGTQKARIFYKAECMDFKGKLIDVESAEIMLSFSMWQSPIRSLPMDYLATFTNPQMKYAVTPQGQYIMENGQYKMAWSFNILSESFRLTSDDWKQEARSKSVQEIFSRVAERIVGTYK
ncbi:MAG: hypothetical protein AB7F75_01805 [Planctomycetota bacterium]